MMVGGAPGDPRRRREGEIRLHALVRGKVQGVSFRYDAAQEARALGLVGWVRNLPDGRTVEVVAEGRRDKLEQLLDWLRHGPPLARVERVDARWQEATGEFNVFRVYD